MPHNMPWTQTHRAVHSSHCLNIPLPYAHWYTTCTKRPTHPDVEGDSDGSPRQVQRGCTSFLTARCCNCGGRRCVPLPPCSTLGSTWPARLAHLIIWSAIYGGVPTSEDRSKQLLHAAVCCGMLLSSLRLLAVTAAQPHAAAAAATATPPARWLPGR